MTAILGHSSDSNYFDAELLPTSGAAGFWGGSLAPILGLQGSCTHEEFHALARGLHPQTRVRLRPRKSAVAWYGLVTSVPLSVSGISHIDPRVCDWFQSAVVESVPFLETLARVRDQRGGSLRRDQLTMGGAEDLELVCPRQLAGRYSLPRVLAVSAIPAAYSIGEG